MRSGADRRKRRWSRVRWTGWGSGLSFGLPAIWSRELLEKPYGLFESSKHKRRKIQRGYGATRNQGSADSATVTFNGWRGRAA